MSDLYLWQVIAVLTIGAVLTRAAFWLVGHHVTIPKRINEALRFAPACALAAVIVPDLIYHHDQVRISFSNPHLVGGVVASAWFLYQRSMFGTILVGMAVYTAVRVFLN
jgi:branched-subunit amino acid transport protein